MPDFVGADIVQSYIDEKVNSGATPLNTMIGKKPTIVTAVGRNIYGSMTIAEVAGSQRDGCFCNGYLYHFSEYTVRKINVITGESTMLTSQTFDSVGGGVGTIFRSRGKYIYMYKWIMNKWSIYGVARYDTELGTTEVFSSFAAAAPYSPPACACFGFDVDSTNTYIYFYSATAVAKIKLSDASTVWFNSTAFTPGVLAYAFLDADDVLTAITYLDSTTDYYYVIRLEEPGGTRVAKPLAPTVGASGPGNWIQPTSEEMSLYGAPVIDRRLAIVPTVYAALKPGSATVYDWWVVFYIIEPKTKMTIRTEPFVYGSSTSATITGVPFCGYYGVLAKGLKLYTGGGPGGVGAIFSYSLNNVEAGSFYIKSGEKLYTDGMILKDGQFFASDEYVATSDGEVTIWQYSFVRIE